MHNIDIEKDIPSDNKNTFFLPQDSYPTISLIINGFKLSCPTKSIDSANIFKGHFHILGGTLNSSENYEQKNLLINSLIKRIKKNNLKEVIIATSTTVEGQTTAHYIEDTLKNGKIKITKLAQGLPVGGEIEQLDDGTLFSAFKNRVPVTKS